MTLSQLTEFTSFIWDINESETALRALGAFRVAFGIAYAVDSLYSLIWKSSLYSVHGVFPEVMHRARFQSRRPNLFSLFKRLPFSSVMLLAVAGTAGIFLALGFLTPLMAFFIFLIQASKRNRNPYASSGADSLIKLLAFLLIFSSAGRAESLDLGLGIFQKWGSPLALILLKLQVAIVLLKSAYWKMRQKSWVDGKMVFRICFTSPAGRASPLLAPLFSINISNMFFTRMIIAVEAITPFFVWFQETKSLTLVVCSSVLVLRAIAFRLFAFECFLLIGLILFV